MRRLLDVAGFDIGGGGWPCLHGHSATDVRVLTPMLPAKQSLAVQPALAGSTDQLSVGDSRSSSGRMPSFCVVPHAADAGQTACP